MENITYSSKIHTVKTLFTGHLRDGDWTLVDFADLSELVAAGNNNITGVNKIKHPMFNFTNDITYYYYLLTFSIYFFRIIQ